ncbi:MAG TPA: Crp/Fnr family transcriptional regulator [Desulfomonilaceae bacterium]|nr:Crp/Fnr family transcriptional regulator [Desulfomonilaceae bacterium]
MEKHRRLRETDIIARLPDSERALLYQESVRKKYPKCAIIHSPGDRGEFVNYVLSGRVKIYNLSACGKEIIYRFCTSNSFFGIAEIFGEDREVFAESMEETEVMCIAKERFEDLIRRHPDIALMVMQILGSRIRQAHRAIMDFVVCDVRARLAQLLIKLAEMNGVVNKDGTTTLKNKFTHQEMANMIGAIRQTVNVNINDLKRAGYIRCADGRITIVSMSRLHELTAD